MAVRPFYLLLIAAALAPAPLLANEEFTNEGFANEESANKELATQPSTDMSSTNMSSANSSTPTMNLTVIDSYAEVRTGPGRGYPVFYAIEQGESIEVMASRPGWYEIRAANGRKGWTSTAELSRTMQASGAPADLPTVGYGDYLRRSWRAGLKSGRFSDGELNGADTFSATAGYKAFSWLNFEVELGKVFDSDLRGRFYAFNIQVEPFSHWRISPFASAGVGSMKIDSQPKLVPLNIEDASYNSYSLGSHYYLGRNFVIQGSYRWYTVDAETTTERLEAWNIGFNAFF